MDVAHGCTWDQARSFLPLDLDGLARKTGLLSRLRGTSSIESLTRLLLLCAMPRASLRTVADWGRENGISRMNSSALFFRLRDAEPFLEGCFNEILRHACVLQPQRFGDLCLVAVDATVLCGPGATGTDQRLHVVYDLGKGLPRSVDLTGPEGGESLARHNSLGSGDLVLGDRGYGHQRGLLACLESGASLLVRFEFNSIRLLNSNGDKIGTQEAASLIPARGWADFPVFLPGWETPLRALGSRNDKDEPVWLITDLTKEQILADEARSLYSQRWQIELFFKRLKSLLDLDELPSRDGPTARPWIWAKLVLCALAVLIADERFSPWGRALGPIGVEALCQRNMELDNRSAERSVA